MAAAAGTNAARHSANVRSASDPGAAIIASAAASVLRVWRASSTRLVSPMKNAEVTGQASWSPGQSSAGAMMTKTALNATAANVAAMKKGLRARRRASMRAIAPMDAPVVCGRAWVDVMTGLLRTKR